MRAAAAACVLFALPAFAQTPPPAVTCDPVQGCRSVAADTPGVDPQPVFPALADGPATLDLTNGATSDLLNSTLLLARELWVLCFVLALLWEAFGSSPGTQKDYAGVFYRSAAILLLLAAYRPIFGSVINLTQDIAARIAPDDAHAKFSALVDYAASARAAETTPGATVTPPPGAPPPSPAQLQQWSSGLGGIFYSGLIGLLILVGAVVHWIFRIGSVILCAFYYVIGPLALVFSVPRISGVGSKWFGHFVTVASWPIFSGVLLAITAQVGGNGLFGQETFGAVCASLMMVATAIATPTIAGKILHGAPSVVEQGAAMAMKAMRGAGNAVQHTQIGQTAANVWRPPEKPGAEGAASSSAAGSSSGPTSQNNGQRPPSNGAGPSFSP
jgi:hypothetical protein